MQIGIESIAATRGVNAVEKTDGSHANIFWVFIFDVWFHATQLTILKRSSIRNKPKTSENLSKSVKVELLLTMCYMRMEYIKD